MSTILLVEDKKNQRLLYEMELQDEGYEVALAADGREALQKAAEEHPDLVVLDLGMPNMDGIETLCRLNGLNDRLPVIIYSAMSQFKDNYLTWIADAFVVKNSNLEVLKQAIKRQLRERQQATQAPVWAQAPS